MDIGKTTLGLFEAWNNRDWDTIRSALHPDYVYTGPDGEDTHGIDDGLIAGWQEHASGLPDGRLEIKSIHVDGDVAVTEFTVRGTHGGTWAGVAPTGKKVEADLCNVTEFKDGKVFRERDYLDTLGLFVQLGIVQVP